MSISDFELKLAHAIKGVLDGNGKDIIRNPFGYILQREGKSLLVLKANFGEEVTRIPLSDNDVESFIESVKKFGFECDAITVFLGGARKYRLGDACVKAISPYFGGDNYLFSERVKGKLNAELSERIEKFPESMPNLTWESSQQPFLK